MTDQATKRIALIHATSAAIAPAESELAEAFDSPDVWNLLDDRLLPDADAAGGLTEPLADRMRGLIAHALAGGADGVLLTCSMYGRVAGETAADVPVLSPDGAAFDAIAARGTGRVLVLSSQAPALKDTLDRLTAHLAERDSAVALEGRVVDGAAPLAKAGDTAGVAAKLEEVATENLDGIDIIFLAQFSLVPAATELEVRLGLPIFSSPRAAATLLAEQVSAR